MIMQTWICTRLNSTFFPFGATLAVSRSGEPGEEDLVISIDGHLQNDRLRMTADIALGGGYVLIDGPELDIYPGNESLKLAEVLQPWLSALAQFLKDQTAMIIRELA